MKKISFLDPTLLLPIGLACYFVAFPFLNNIQHLRVHYFYSSLVKVLLITVVLFLIFKVIYKQVRTAALTTAIFIFLFNSYALVWGWIEKRFSDLLDFNQYYDLAILWGGIIYLVLIVLVVHSLSRLIHRSDRWRKVITVFTTSLTISLLISAGVVYIAKYPYLAHNWSLGSSRQLFPPQMTGKQLSHLPDIYLIVLDGYTSNEVLSTLYNFDNSEFTSELEKLGFVVIQNARSNYNQTRTSFSSLLNIEYLDDVAVQVGTDKIDARPLADLIQSNLVVENLRSAGYEIINFPSEYEYTENIQADQSYFAQPYISSLDHLLIANSGLYPFIHHMLYQWHRDEVLYPLSELSKLPDSPAPRFVMVHIYSPHPPFVFDVNGNPVEPPYRYTGADANEVIKVSSLTYYRKQYTEQIQFISSQVLESVTSLLETSERKPIIILSGDHGPRSIVPTSEVDMSIHFERMHILNALYLPGVDASTIQVDHTPVNTFRVIFNEYFGSEYLLLPNRSFASSMLFPYQFEDVTEAAEKLPLQ